MHIAIENLNLRFKTSIFGNETIKRIKRKDSLKLKKKKLKTSIFWLSTIQPLDMLNTAVENYIII